MIQGSDCKLSYVNQQGQRQTISLSDNPYEVKPLKGKKVCGSFMIPLHLEKSVLEEIGLIDFNNWINELERIQTIRELMTVKSKESKLLEKYDSKEQRYQAKVRKFMKQMEGRK